MLITLFKHFLLPPAMQLGLMTLAVVLWWRWKRVSIGLMVLAWLSLLLLSIPLISASLFHWLESPYLSGVAQEQQQVARAVVVLGGGRERNNPEFAGADQVSHQALWRLRYAARVAKQLDLPVVVTGGRVYGYEQQAEAELAEDLLIHELGVEEVWLETESETTWDNAFKTAQLLRNKNVQRVILVTHAYHMRRSEAVFRYAGVEVIPMATGFISTDIQGWWNDYIPTAGALHDSRIALHEYLGLLFYWLRQ